MNGLHVLLGVAGLLVLVVIAIAVLRYLDPPPTPPDPDILVLLRELEALRRMIQRETGREISELVLRGGKWYAVTSRGEELVADMLRRGRHNLLGGVQP